MYVTHALLCVIPINSSLIEIMELFNTKIDCPILTMLGDLDRFMHLDLSRNRPIGTIITELGNSNSLANIYLEENILAGTMTLDLWGITNIFES